MDDHAQNKEPLSATLARADRDPEPQPAPRRPTISPPMGGKTSADLDADMAEVAKLAAQDSRRRLADEERAANLRGALALKGVLAVHIEQCGKTFDQITDATVAAFDACRKTLDMLHAATRDGKGDNLSTMALDALSRMAAAARG